MSLRCTASAQLIGQVCSNQSPQTFTAAGRSSSRHFFFKSMCLVAVSERLPQVACARSAWRFATPCRLAARTFRRGMLLPDPSRLQEFFQKRLQLSFHGRDWGSAVLARSASGCPNPSRTSSRFSEDTMFSVILLTSALFVMSNLQDLGRQKGFQSSPQLAMPCAVCVPALLPFHEET